MKSRSGTGLRVEGAKIPRTFRLTEGKVEAAQEILGTETATATIEAALDMVIFRHELVTGTATLYGVDIEHVG